ncbi:DUF3757 domain-containing protein [Pseudomonas viridiflava]|uniref:DUF3757 domain-containing protein n=1 Tax=Pseudomonas viridiflava TaxID=33069 RepID=UPI002EBD2601|nr:DUF3757 domain-containing protein [Pseudomonas viridiflava]
MNIILSGLAAATLLMGLSTASQAMESCPAASTIIQDSAGIYTARGEQGEWTSKTPVNKLNLGPNITFLNATVLQADEKSPQELQKCIYKTQDGMSLDLYFITTNKKEFTVNIQGASWKAEPGYFGSINNVCENTTPENCRFTIVQ